MGNVTLHNLERACSSFNRSDFDKQQLTISDLDQASADFQSLLDVTSRQMWDLHSQETQPQVVVSDLTDTNLPSLPRMENQRTEVTVVYDDIVGSFLGPLSQRVAGRVRLAKEQAARRLTADVCLASHSIGPSPADQLQGATRGSAGSQSGNIPIPFRTDALGPGMTGSSQDLGMSSQALPTPSPSATPSLASNSLSSHPSTLVASEYAHLQRLTTFSSDKVAPAPLLKSLSNMLAHWKPGGDPDQYDWLAAQRQLDKEAEFEDEDLTPEERARLKRRAEKHLRRQRRETALAQSQGLLSSQAPGLVSSSQVVPIGVSQPLGFARSQVTQSQGFEFPASQVEPGRFGGRAPAKKRRRTQGF